MIVHLSNRNHYYIFLPAVMHRKILLQMVQGSAQSRVTQSCLSTLIPVVTNNLASSSRSLHIYDAYLSSVQTHGCTGGRLDAVGDCKQR